MKCLSNGVSFRDFATWPLLIPAARGPISNHLVYSCCSMSISASALKSQVLMNTNEWAVNLWPNLFDSAVASPPTTPPYGVLSVPMWAGGQVLLLILLQGR